MNVKRLFGETIIYGIGAILPRVITFLLNPLYIHYIDRASFAIFTSLYSWVAFVNILLTFGFETAYFRFASDKNSDHNSANANLEKTVFNTAFWFITALAGTFLLAILAFSQPIANVLDYGSHPEFLRWFAWIAFFDAICTIPFAWLRYHSKPVTYSVIRVISILVQTVVVIALFRFIPSNVSQSFGLTEQVSFPFFSNLLASGVTFLMLLPILKQVKFEFDRALFGKMLRYAYPMMWAGLAFMVNENFDKIYQYYTISKADAGAYGGCYKLAVLMTLFVTAYRMGIEPFFFKQMKNANAKITYAKVTEFFTLFASVVALGIIANISWLKRLFITDESYWVAIEIVPIIVIANLCFGIYYNLSTWYKVTDRTQIGMAMSWIGAGLTILLHVLFLEKYGFMVSAWVTLAVYFVMMVLSYILGQKFYPIPYQTKKLGFFLGLLAVFSVLIVTVFNMNFWLSNLLFLVFFGAVGFSEKDWVKKLVKR